MGGIFKSIFSSSEPVTIIKEVRSDEASISQETQARQRRANQSGYSNIATSARGLSAQSDALLPRKNLLGE